MICRNAVPVPCPRSVLPTEKVAVLSSRMTIHESSWRKSTSGYGPATLPRLERQAGGGRADADDEKSGCLEEVAPRCAVDDGIVMLGPL